MESAPRPISVNSRILFRYTDKSPELCHEEDRPEGRFHSSYRIREDLTHEPMTENLRFVYLELGRFKKKLWELETRFEKWMYLFRNIQEMIVRPDVFSENEFERLFTLARIANFTAQEMEDYMHTFKQCDYYNVIRTAEEEARERGHAIGLAEGRAEGLAEGRVSGFAEGKAEGKAEGRAEGERNMALNIAKRLLASGMSIEEVTKMTGLNTMDIADLS